MDDKTNIYPIKLVKFLASAGIASRRNSFDFIKNSKVSVNGIINQEPSTLINKDDKVVFNGKSVFIEETVYIMLNKPKGYVCTSSDKFAEKKAIDLIDIKKIRLFSIGRLDKDSQGLILFTNDGEFANKLTHPRNQIEKKYIVKLQKSFKKTDIEKILSGAIESGDFLKAESVSEISKNTYQITLKEGKKREIRRLAKSVNNRVIQLKRISIGRLQLGTLPEGKWKQLTKKEIILALNK